MKPKPTKYAKIGEYVRIVEPMVFQRCGYPLTQAIVTETRQEEVMALLTKAQTALGIKGDRYHGASSRLIDAICSMILEREKFGGKERKIYEQEKPSLKGKHGLITARRYVNVGTYEPGYMSSGWEYEGEWNPPSLDIQRRACIYRVDIDMEWMPIEIDAIHCERMPVQVIV